MHTPRPTFTFFLLVALAAVSAYGALLLTTQLSGDSDVADSTLTNQHKDLAAAPNSASAAPASIDISNWKQYTDLTYFLSFKYPPTWQVQTYPSMAGYYIIVIKPDSRADNVRIYVSPNTYFALDGLPTKKDTLGGAQALNINDSLFGVKYSAQYYTFDRGNTAKLQPQFQQIIDSVAFNR